jgi:hypothetical protein
MRDRDGLFISGVRLPRRIANRIEAQVQGGEARGFLTGDEGPNREFQIDGLATEQSAPPEAIGWYRGHRGPGLQPSEQDVDVIQQHFARGRAVLLLVKPLSATESVGAFFRCEDGVILEPRTSSAEFSFPRPSHPSKAGRWLIPSAIAAGIAAACLVRCAGQWQDENPVTRRQPLPINSSSDARVTKPFGATSASPSTGKLWP